MFKPSQLFALLALTVSAAAIADDAQIYKWTDAQGVIHYSDKAPAQPAPDLQAMDMPSFPVQDPAKLAAEQAQLVAEVAATQKLLQAQLDEQAQADALATQQAQLQTELAAQQQSDSGPTVEPIYVNSAFVPRAYRANLYVPHHSGAGSSRPTQTAPSRPAIPVLKKPR